MTSPAPVVDAPPTRRRRRWPIGAAVAGALLLLAAAAIWLAPSLDRDRVRVGGGGAAEPQPRQLVGVQLHPFFSDQTPQTVDRELDLARRTGANSIRIDLVWSSLQLRGPGRFDPDLVDRVDRVLAGARRRGLHVVLMLWSTPCWASSAPEALRQGCRGAWWQRGVNAYPPRDPATFGAAAAEVARRWGGDIAALEIWNEPNYEQFLSSPAPARDYGRLLRAAYDQVKAVRPELAVLAGSLALADGDFLRQLYTEGGIAGHYDGLAWHPYAEPYGPRASARRAGRERSFRGGARWLRLIALHHDGRRPELWATEAGAAACDVRASERCHSQATQARWVSEYVRIGRRLPWLRALIVYNLRDKGTDPRDPEAGFGLVRRDFAPKPALGAFESALRP